MPMPNKNNGQVMSFLAKKTLEQRVNHQDDFYFPVFHMGNFNMPSRESLYDEACDRHLNNDWAK